MSERSGLVGRRGPPVGLIVVALVCLTLNVATYTGIVVLHPEYLTDARMNPNPDAWDYVVQGRNLWKHGVYSRQEGPPYAPDGLRTPGYPVIVGALDALGGLRLVYLAQALLHVLASVTVYRIAASSFESRTAAVAGLLCATDVNLLSHGFQAMSEATFVAGLALTVLLFMRIVRDPEPGVDRVFVVGAAIGILALVRPVALYLPLLCAIIVIVIAAGERRAGRGALHALVLVAGAGLVVAPWFARNHHVLGIDKLTTNDAIVLVYFTGAGAYQVEHRVTHLAALHALAEEYSLPVPRVAWRPWEFGASPKEIDTIVRSALPDVVTRYPRALAVSTVLGIVKAHTAHSARELSAILGEPWNPPGRAALSRLDRRALLRLLENTPALVAAFTWQTIHTGVVCLALLLAVARLIDRNATGRPSVLVGLVLLGYFVALLGLSGVEATARFRVPSLILEHLLAAAGLTYLAERLVRVRTAEPVDGRARGSPARPDRYPSEGR